MLGLLELSLVLFLALAWGLRELWSLRRDRRARDAVRPPSDPTRPAP